MTLRIKTILSDIRMSKGVSSHYRKREREFYRQHYLLALWRDIDKVIPNLESSTQRYYQQEDKSKSEYVAELKSHLISLVNRYRKHLPPNNKASKMIHTVLRNLSSVDNHQKAKNYLANLRNTTVTRI